MTDLTARTFEVSGYVCIHVLRVPNILFPCDSWECRDQVWLMVHHRFDLEASDGAEGIRRKSGGGTGGGLDRMSRALQMPPTEVFEIITQHRRVLSWRWLPLLCTHLENCLLLFGGTRRFLFCFFRPESTTYLVECRLFFDSILLYCSYDYADRVLSLWPSNTCFTVLQVLYIPSPQALH